MSYSVPWGYRVFLEISWGVDKGRGIKYVVVSIAPSLLHRLWLAFSSVLLFFGQNGCKRDKGCVKCGYIMQRMRRFCAPDAKKDIPVPQPQSSDPAPALHQVWFFSLNNASEARIFANLTPLNVYNAKKRK